MLRPDMGMHGSGIHPQQQITTNAPHDAEIVVAYRTTGRPYSVKSAAVRGLRIIPGRPRR